jgi:hypothetical protein
MAFDLKTNAVMMNSSSIQFVERGHSSFDLEGCLFKREVESFVLSGSLHKGDLNPARVLKLLYGVR